jgi:hypothetical protein
MVQEYRAEESRNRIGTEEMQLKEKIAKKIE